MTLPAIANPFAPFVGLEGRGINDGDLYIGVVGSDPQTFPQDCFWDAAGITPATQPIDVQGGYPMRLGSPARVYTAPTYSMRLRDRQGAQVFYEATASNVPNATDVLASLGIFPTRAAAIAATIPTPVRTTGVFLCGYSVTGDGGGGQYKYVAAMPSHQGRFQSADGAWWELIESPVSVKMLGATGDGVTNDTTACQNALSMGRPVHFPATEDFYHITGGLSLAVEGQQVTGDGALSLVIQSGTNAAASVFGTAFDDCSFSGLHCQPGTTVASTTQGWGFVIDGADRVTVRDCFVSQHRRGGVLMNNSNNCIVTDNVFFDSVVPNNRSVPQSDTGYDVYCYGTSSYNLIRGNQCISGAGVGVACQTNAGGVSQYGNVVEGNFVKDQPVYGIMLYLSGTIGVDFIDHMIVRGNHVENISGSIDTGANNFYGAGIYVQTSDHFVIEGNLVKSTNTDRSAAYSGSAVPAAIAISGLGNGVVNGNVIEDCYWGIASGQAVAITAAGRGTVISNNTIRDADFRGIYLADCASATVVGNRVHGTLATATQGIFLVETTSGHMDDFIITGNRVENFNVGIESTGTPINRMTVADNIIRANTGAGITARATTCQIHNNDIQSAIAGSVGINMPSTAVNGHCRFNYIDVVTTGIVNDSGGTLEVDQNIITTASTPFSSNVWNLLDATATPSVRGGPCFRIADAHVNVTAFTNSYPGQEITIRSLGAVTLVNGAGMTLTGAANFVMAAEDMIVLRQNGSRFVETSRMVA